VDGPRACLTAELPALLAAANRVFRPAGGDMGQDYPLLFSADNRENLRVLVDAQGVAAHAGLCLRRVAFAAGGDDGGGAHSVTVGAVGAVFTRDDQRNRGLGGAVVRDVLARARAAGATLVLVSGDGPLYQRLGFVPAPPARCWDCAPPLTRPDAGVATEIDVVAVTDDAPGQTPGGATEPAAGPAGWPLPAADAIPLLARFHDAEAVHFVRSVADWRALLGAATLFAWPARLWIVRRQVGDVMQPVGYLAVAQRARRRVLEFAGDRAAIVAAAPLVADELVPPWHDQETARRAREQGWRARPLPLGIASLWLEAPGSPLPLPWYGLNYV